MISDEQIKQAAIARGFKLNNENGDDLKPYVYEFARDLIAMARHDAFSKGIEICTELGNSLITPQMRNACMECAYEIKKLRNHND